MIHHTILGTVFAVLLACLGFVPATASAANAPDKSVVVHQGGVRAVHVERRVLKAVLDDDAECAGLQHTRHSVTFYAQSCAAANYGVFVTVRNDGGSKSVLHLVAVVKEAQEVPVTQTDTGTMFFGNPDGDPKRCDFNRSGEDVMNRYVGEDGISVKTSDNDITWSCHYIDGAPAGSGTVSVVQLKPKGYLYVHPKSETITAGLNNSRGNVEASFRYIPAGDQRSEIVVQPGEFPREPFSFQESGWYVLKAQQYGGKWIQVARVYVDVHSPRIK